MTEPYILVLYYSRHGSVLNLARAIAKGIESAGIEAKIRTVSDADQSESDYPVVTIEELTQCSGLAMGSPCHFGIMASPLKRFWEQTSTQWLSGDLIDKPAVVFSSSSSLHGGNEATLLGMTLPLMHHGMMILGIPYSNPALNNTESGGTPYGASHVSGLKNNPQLTDDEAELAKAVGKRLATTAKQLIQKN